MSVTAAKAFVSLGIACSYCGDEASSVDHINPLSAFASLSKEGQRAIFGTDDPDSASNLTPACRSCNASKKDTPLRIWIQRCVAETFGCYAYSPTRSRVASAILTGRCADWVADVAREAVSDMAGTLTTFRDELK